MVIPSPPTFFTSSRAGRELAPSEGGTRNTERHAKGGGGPQPSTVCARRDSRPPPPRASLSRNANRAPRNGDKQASSGHPTRESHSDTCSCRPMPSSTRPRPQGLRETKTRRNFAPQGADRTYLVLVLVAHVGYLLLRLGAQSVVLTEQFFALPVGGGGSAHPTDSSQVVKKYLEGESNEVRGPNRGNVN